MPVTPLPCQGTGRHFVCPASSTGLPEQAGTVPQSGGSFCSLERHNFLFPGTETFATWTKFLFAIWDLFELEMQSRDEPWGPQESIPTTYLQLGGTDLLPRRLPCLAQSTRAMPALAVGEPPGTGSPQS